MLGLFPLLSSTPHFPDPLIQMIHGKLLGIAIRAKSHAPMQELDIIDITSDDGCVGDSRGRSRGRQVTVLSREAWQAACADLGRVLPWTERRANLLVEGFELAETVSSRLCIGDVVLEITGETDPCRRMTNVARGLREALTPAWRGGVCCRVIEGGQIRVGDSVTLRPTRDV
jgi:MOSC domain-containing protein YiiM